MILYIVEAHFVFVYSFVICFDKTTDFMKTTNIPDAITINLAAVSRPHLWSMHLLNMRAIRSADENRSEENMIIPARGR